MKTKACLLFVSAALAISVSHPVTNCFAQSSTFTYQGRLTSGASAYTGVAEIQPTLWDAATGGTQVAGNNPSSVLVNVTNGLFVLPLDFGNTPFGTGADRWLEIQLRTTLGPFTTLTPRQRITATPYALRAANAATAATATTANSVNAANIIGTLGLAQLPGTLVTNSQTGVNLTGAFSGNGAGLSNITATPQILESTNLSIVSWGRNDDGERNVPASLANARILSVSPGAFHSLALKNDGTVVAWGAGVTNGPEGNGAHYGQSLVPSGLANVRAISAGYVHSVALRSNGTVVAWGWNEYNQTNVPPTVNNIIAISAAGYHNLALKSDGTVVAWGTNFQPQLIDVPPGLNNAVAVSAGIYHNLALKANGTVVVWGGDNQFNQTNMPGGLTDIKAIAAGGAHSLVLRSNGTVVAWGAGLVNDPSINGVDYGQSMVPAGLSNVVAISAGVYHSLAFKADGTVVAWGSNQYDESRVPPGLNNVVSLGIGSVALHSMVLRKRFEGPLAVLDSDNTFNGNIQVNGSLHTFGDASAKSLRLDDGNLFLRGGNDQNNALGWFGPGKTFAYGEANGAVLFGEAGGALGSSDNTNGQQIALAWDNQKRVGIGTTTPNAPLSFGQTSADMKLLLYDNNDGFSGVGLGGGDGYMTLHLNSSSGRFLFMDAPGGTTIFTIQAAGSSANVGVGTASPTSALDVRGDIRFGASGQFSPSAGVENLRIIRGSVNSTGAILDGQGFTPSRTGVGTYQILFSAPFSGTPTVTASAFSGVTRVVTVTVVGTTSAQFRVTDPTALADSVFHFIAIGPR
ncbi:MAG TPA: hypothetical protein VJ063_07445 [Verrucomicrobiae bacterium]|nr:hypothetical protein [Verrucomicrobiae bacterium]